MNAKSPPTQRALDVLTFAEKMLRIVRKDRDAKLDAGTITKDRHDRDIACAMDLCRLARQDILDDAPLN